MCNLCRNTGRLQKEVFAGVFYMGPCTCKVPRKIKTLEDIMRDQNNGWVKNE